MVPFRDGDLEKMLDAFVRVGKAEECQ